MIRMTQVSKTIGNNLILDSINLEFKAGEITVLFGPNGSGKTTLMSILAGLVSASTGTIEYENKIDQEWTKRHATFVASGNRSLYYRLTGRDNLHYLAVLKGVYSQTFQERIDEYSKMFGISMFVNKPVRSMSVGQQKKIALVSALINESKLIILDEASDGLDRKSKEELSDALLLAKKHKLCVVIASHDLEFVSMICDEVVKIDSGKIRKSISLKNDLSGEARLLQLKEVLYE